MIFEGLQTGPYKPPLPHPRPFHYKNRCKYIGNKLDQRQSQTPISSAFWVKEDFGLKKLLGQKSVSTEIILVPKKLGPNILGPKKVWVQK